MNKQMFEELDDILNNDEELENFKDFMGLDDDFFENKNTNKNNNNSNNSNSNSSNSNSNNSNSFNIGDIFNNISPEQMSMLSTVIQNFTGDNQNDISNLLQALKPFLDDSKKQKVDMALGFLNILNIMPNMDILNFFGGNNNNANK
ncbi:MAG: hypothetical protein ACRCZK_00420 [Oscillospiraceae bacterium]